MGLISRGLTAIRNFVRHVSEGSSQATASRLLANARPRGSKTVACHIREWHNSTAIFNRDNVNDVIV